MRLYFLLSALFFSGMSSFCQTFPWKNGEILSGETVLSGISVPEGFERMAVLENSFGNWLRHLPLKSGKPIVYLYDGRKKWNQSAQYAVIDIDTGERDLQQCADAVMRLRAEYLFSSSHQTDIAFNFTSGDRCSYTEWSKGMRPRVNGNKVSWLPLATSNHTYKSFRKYLNTVFAYAGTYSLKKEMFVQTMSDLTIGDVFIQGGFPGHAVLVVDVAVHKSTGEKIFLLIQSYMPAQDMHILKNLEDSSLSPWFRTGFGEALVTPEWTFQHSDLRRFD